MAMKVLEANIDNSMRCNIEFNGVIGYEVSNGYKQYTICLKKREHTYRYKIDVEGISCAHALAAMLHKQNDPHDFIHSCYSKESKLAKTGVIMTCILCHVKGHNKKGWNLLRTDEVGSTKPISNESEPITNRRKGRPRTTTPPSNKRSSASIATDFASTSQKHGSSASASE
ncbi:hypothetical protein H5410_060631 [Solanum commersonii]|uniref:Zinc finger PMZ-type domain-containing protein n=1 Tax=Solanum commersonii TaxID=4109 RepID=A0A9J5W5Z7_SOLCO|nr:hypothetical protein H5410_060631 [Solanum commersonii]